MLEVQGGNFGRRFPTMIADRSRMFLENLFSLIYHQSLMTIQKSVESRTGLNWSRSLGWVLAGVFAFGTMVNVRIAVCQDLSASPDPQRFPKAVPLTLQSDLASQMVDGIDRFLLRKTSESESKRLRHWSRDFESDAAYTQSIAVNKTRLAEQLGMVDERIFPVPILRQRISESDPKGQRFRVYSVQWPVLEDPDPMRSITSVYGQGLLLEPVDAASIVANMIAIPDCDQTPAQICGLVDGVDPESQFARHLAERNCRVIVPMLISRELKQRNGRSTLTNREFINRSAYELGRHVIGYEVQKVQSAIDAISSKQTNLPLGVIGSGGGGRIALAVAALDDRVDAVCLSGCIGPSESMWKQPIDCNIFGWLDEFGNAEMLTMVAPRKVLVNHCQMKLNTFDGTGGGAPGEIATIPIDKGRGEVERGRQLVSPLIDQKRWSIQETTLRKFPCDLKTAVQFVELLTGRDLEPVSSSTAPTITALDEVAMQTRALEQLDRHNQLLLRESPFVRREFMKGIDTSSMEKFSQSSERYREIFRDDVVGSFDDSLLPANARVRKTWERPGWTGYEVVLDVFPDVIAYGVLLVPNDLKPDEKRPVVVCQHGLEGRPTDTFLGDHRAYHDYAAELAKRGFITFAPQNPYLFKDRFRTLQRKANPLGKTLFSVIVPQHQQIVNWLKSLPNVDGDRIAFYGLSYGGKSAMRIPAIVTDYCLSICSADFNEWVRKNASTRHNFSYVWTGEYEMFDWNLGGTFNYAEMATLICPRPFMVERGHFDGVGADEWVAYEYAKVRNLYAARLKIGDQTEIEWFNGPHMINGKGTFDFLHKHLDWPKK